MAQIYVSIGSNIQPAENIRSCIAALSTLYPDLAVSSVYKSKSIGFDGEDFYNLVAGFESDKDIYTIIEQMKEIETLHNRARKSHRFTSRTLDIDLLLYGDMVMSTWEFNVPRDEIMQYAFVLCPLAEIAGDEIHPVTGATYQLMWQKFTDKSQQLSRLEFQW
jgi:2-amino-4-hydroxy-6-hydroxymethyldihydropteridine diphosphokinase